MLFLRTFGGLSIENAGQPIGGAAGQRRRLAVLAVLAAAPGAAVSRDRLLAMFWPESDDERARNALKQALFALRRDLGEPHLTVGTSELRLNSAVVASDFGLFKKALSQGDLASAVAIQKGAFLDGIHLKEAPEFDQWADAVRRALRADHSAALEGLVAEASKDGATQAAMRYAEQLVAHEPLNTRHTLTFMRLLEDGGDRAGAIQHADYHEQQLRKELNCSPPREFYEHLIGLKARSSNATEAPASSGRVPWRPPVDHRRPPALNSLYARRATVVALCLVTVVTAWTLRTQPAPGAILVLPFVNVADDKATDYFSDGLTEELINALTGVSGLHVVPRSSSFALKGQPIDIAQLRKVVGVQTIVAGTVRRLGGRVRVRVELVDARTNTNLKSVTVERPEREVFLLQDELSATVIASLGHTFGGRRARSNFRRGTTNAEAYDMFLRGLFASNSATEREGLVRAIALFDSATRIDPSFARPSAGAALAWVVLADNWEAPMIAYPKAEAAARKAIGLDATLAEAHAALSKILTLYRWDFVGGHAEAARAVAENPQSVQAHVALAFFYTCANMRDSALAEVAEVERIDPLSPGTWRSLEIPFYKLGLYEEALRIAVRFHELTGDSRWLRSQAMLMWFAGRAREAESIARLACPKTSQSACPGIVTAVRDGKPAIRRWLEMQDTAGTHSPYVASYFAARAAVYLGDPDRAIAALERGYRDRDANLAFIHVEPVWNPLRSNPRFQALQARVGNAANAR
jgi:DNA-binding SARP family transcriptional activator/TolB-like protein/tetratricopeptide (TPR) repeat protein